MGLDSMSFSKGVFADGMKEDFETVRRRRLSSTMIAETLTEKAMELDEIPRRPRRSISPTRGISDAIAAALKDVEDTDSVADSVAEKGVESDVIPRHPRRSISPVQGVGEAIATALKDTEDIDTPEYDAMPRRPRRSISPTRGISDAIAAALNDMTDTVENTRENDAMPRRPRRSISPTRGIGEAIAAALKDVEDIEPSAVDVSPRRPRRSMSPTRGLDSRLAAALNDYDDADNESLGEKVFPTSDTMPRRPRRSMSPTAGVAPELAAELYGYESMDMDDNSSITTETEDTYGPPPISFKALDQAPKLATRQQSDACRQTYYKIRRESVEVVDYGYEPMDKQDADKGLEEGQVQRMSNASRRESSEQAKPDVLLPEKMSDKEEDQEGARFSFKSIDRAPKPVTRQRTSNEEPSFPNYYEYESMGMDQDVVWETPDTPSTHNKRSKGLVRTPSGIIMNNPSPSPSRGRPTPGPASTLSLISGSILGGSNRNLDRRSRNRRTDSKEKLSLNRASSLHSLGDELNDDSTDIKPRRIRSSEATSTNAGPRHLRANRRGSAVGRLEGGPYLRAERVKHDRDQRGKARDGNKSMTRSTSGSKFEAEVDAPIISKQTNQRPRRSQSSQMGSVEVVSRTRRVSRRGSAVGRLEGASIPPIARLGDANKSLNEIDENSIQKNMQRRAQRRGSAMGTLEGNKLNACPSAPMRQKEGKTSGGRVKLERSVASNAEKPPELLVTASSTSRKQKPRKMDRRGSAVGRLESSSKPNTNGHHSESHSSLKIDRGSQKEPEPSPKPKDKTPSRVSNHGKMSRRGSAVGRLESNADSTLNSCRWAERVTSKSDNSAQSVHLPRKPDRGVRSQHDELSCSAHGKLQGNTSITSNLDGLLSLASHSNYPGFAVGTGNRSVLSNQIKSHHDNAPGKHNKGVLNARAPPAPENPDCLSVASSPGPRGKHAGFRGNNKDATGSILTSLLVGETDEDLNANIDEFPFELGGSRPRSRSEDVTDDIPSFEDWLDNMIAKNLSEPVAEQKIVTTKHQKASRRSSAVGRLEGMLAKPAGESPGVGRNHSDHNGALPSEQTTPLRSNGSGRSSGRLKSLLKANEQVLAQDRLRRIARGALQRDQSKRSLMTTDTGACSQETQSTHGSITNKYSIPWMATTNE